MARLHLVIDVPDADPARLDPRDFAELLIDTYHEDRRHVANPGPEVESVSAEWATDDGEVVTIPIARLTEVTRSGLVGNERAAAILRVLADATQGRLADLTAAPAP